MRSSPELDRLAALGWRPGDHGTLQDGVWHVGPDASVSYPSEGFAALGAHGGGSFWFDHRADEVLRQLRRFAPGRVAWEIGAGTGAMTSRLASAGVEVVAVEPLPAGARAIADQSAVPVFCALLEDMSLPSGVLEVVGMFDVVEHLPDPRQVLTEVRRVLRPDGLLVVTVPAYAWLWSDEDNAAGHQIRFTRTRLDVLLTAAGFERRYSSHLYASLVLPAGALRALPYRLGRRRDDREALNALADQLDPPRVVDAALRRVLRWESALSRRRSLPFGTSVLGVYAPA